jgi:hypothetical protein
MAKCSKPLLTVVLGLSYLPHAFGQTETSAESLKTLRARAEQGEAVTQYNLGVRYNNGEGVARDYAEAVRWYRKAAEQGYSVAQCWLGIKYWSGEGVTQDSGQAVRWLREAAAQGEALAQYGLGTMYERGRGVAQDFVQAHMWMNLAASRVNGDNQKLYAEARDMVARKMTPSQIAEAQRLAREWKPKI